MPKILRQRLFQLTLIPALLTTLILPAPAGGPVLHWEKIHVLHVDATTVFKRLGMTHSTKNGYTRDGKKGVADPDFPPGLTDVVPSDAEHILLVRGTEGGLSLFRIRVAAADAAVLPRHLKAELSRRDGSGETVIGTAEIDTVLDGIPAVISLGDEQTKRTYQITTRLNADGTRWVSCRISLPLPTGLADSTNAEIPPAVFVPNQVWTDPLSRKIKPGEIALFEDLAAFRQTASRRLGRTEIDTTADFTLRISLTPIS